MILAGADRLHFHSNNVTIITMISKMVKKIVGDSHEGLGITVAALCVITSPVKAGLLVPFSATNRVLSNTSTNIFGDNLYSMSKCLSLDAPNMLMNMNSPHGESWLL